MITSEALLRAGVGAALGAGAGFGMHLATRGVRHLSPGTAGTGSRREPARNSSVGGKAIAKLAPPRTLLTALAVGLAAFVVTRWPMALLLGVASVLASRGLKSGMAKDGTARLEAIASWTEMLRDTLAGASGLSQALVSTAATAPKPVRSEIEKMASRLNSGVAAEAALAGLAEDLADPAGDMVVASLVMASRERAQRLGDLLGALAEASREEVAMRLGVEASRASARSAVRMITGFSLGLFALMSIFARSYLAPYRSSAGQLVLGVVGLVFGFGLWLMSVMVRPSELPRLELGGDAT